MELQQMLEDVLQMARQEQNRCLEMAIQDMELVRHANMDPLEKAAFEERIQLLLLLSLIFHAAIRWKPDTLRGISLLRVAELHLDVGELPVTLRDELQDAVLEKIERVLASISAFQDQHF